MSRFLALSTNARLVALVLVAGCCQAVLGFDIPRYDGYNMQEVSSDMGDYDFFKCQGEGSGRSCEFDNEAAMSYGAGVGLYSGFNVVALVLILILLIISVCFWVVKWLCKLTCCCCCKKKKDPDAPERIDDPDKTSNCDMCRMFMFGCTIVGIPLLFLLFNYQGNAKVTENSYGLVNAPAGFQTVAMSAEPSMTRLFLSIFSFIIAPMMTSLNATITTAVDLDNMTKSMITINGSLKEFPRVSVLFDTGYSLVNISVNQSLPILGDLVDEILVLNQTAHNITSGSTTMLSMIQAIPSANDELNYWLDESDSALDEITNVMNTYIGTAGSPGVIGDMIDDMNTLYREPAGSIPAAGSFNWAEYGETELAAGTYTGDSVAIEAFNANLTSLYYSMRSLPNYTVTSQNLANCKSTALSINAPSGVLQETLYIISNLTYILENYPSLSRISDQLNIVEEAVQSITLDPVIAEIEKLVNVFSGVTDLIVDVHDEVARAAVFTELVGAFRVFVYQVYTIDTTLVSLPQNFLDFANDYNKNTNTTDLLADLDDLLEVIRDMNETVVDVFDDIKYDILPEMKNVSFSITDTLNTYSISGILGDIAAALDDQNEVNFTTARLMIHSFKSSLDKLEIEDSLVSDLSRIQSSIAGNMTLLQRVINTTAGGPNGDTKGDYLWLAGGYCDSDDAILCLSNGDCPGSCIGQGTYRCSANGATTCADDATCESLTAGSYCLMDLHTAHQLIAFFGGFANTDNDVNPDSNLLQNLTDVTENDVNDLDDAYVGRNLARDAIASFDVLESEDMLNELIDAIDDLDLSQYFDTVKDAYDDLNDNVDEYNPKKKLDDYVDYADYQDDFNREFSGWIDTAVVFRNFFYDDAHLASTLRNLSASNLEHIWELQGPSAMIGYILSQLDNIVDYFADNVDSFEVKRTNYKEEKKRFKILDKLGAYAVAGYGDMAANGAVYYLQRLANAATVRADVPTTMGVVVDSNYERYPNDHYCTTSSCEEHSLDVINYEPLSEWSKEFPGFTAGDSIDYTRDEVMFAMWIPPLLTALFGLCTACLNFKLYYEKTRHCCTFMFMGCVYCQLPFILLFTALMFPMGVIFHDMCTTGSGIGRTAMIAYGDSMCANVLGGEGGLNDCRYNVTLSDDYNVTLKLNIVDFYEGMVAGECTGSDPFADLFVSIGEQMRDMPSRAANDMFEGIDVNSNSSWVVQPMLKKVITDAAGNVGGVLHDYFVNASVFAMNCNTVSSVANNMSGSTCGSFAAPVMWMVGTWYLVGWILVCCAFPAGFKEKKYFKKDAPADSESESSEDAENANGEVVDIREGAAGDGEYLRVNSAEGDVRPVAISPPKNGTTTITITHNSNGIDGKGEYEMV